MGSPGVPWGGAFCSERAAKQSAGAQKKTAGGRGGAFFSRLAGRTSAGSMEQSIRKVWAVGLKILQLLLECSLELWG